MLPESDAIASLRAQDVLKQNAPDVLPPDPDALREMSPEEIQAYNLRNDVPTYVGQDTRSLPIMPVSARNPFRAPERAMAEAMVTADLDAPTPTEQALASQAASTAILTRLATRERELLAQPVDPSTLEPVVTPVTNSDGNEDGFSVWYGDAYVGFFATQEEADEAASRVEDDALHSGIMRSAAERAGRNH